MSRVGWIVPGLVAIALGAAAQAQSNLDAGKSPAQIFSDTCNACHRSPRELKPTSPAYLREHYTTGAREAAAMAAYVASVGSDPRAVQQRKPPTMGAGQAPAADTASRPPQTVPSGEQAKPPDAQAALPAATPARRTQAGDQAKPPPGQASTAALRPRRPSESIETAKPLATLATGAISAAAEAPASNPPVLDPFEE